MTTVGQLQPLTVTPTVAHWWSAADFQGMTLSGLVLNGQGPSKRWTRWAEGVRALPHAGWGDWRPCSY